MDQSSRQAGPRAFRSRRDRPCDACRKRKVACQIATTPPCTFCSNRGSDCTFEKRPSNKRRRVTPSDSTANDYSHPTEDPTLIYHQWTDFDTEAFDNGIFDGLDLVDQPSLILPETTALWKAHSSDGDIMRASPIANRQQSSASSTEDVQSIKPGALHDAQVTPDTGHLNRHVILGLMKSADSLNVSGIRLRLAQAYDERPGRNQPMLMVREYAPLSFSAKSFAQRASWTDIEGLVCEKQRRELVRLFFHFIQPAFPVLQPADADSDHDNSFATSSTCPALSASIYATALPFSIHSDYLNATLTDTSGKREQLYSIALACLFEDAKSPTISTLQACLIVLQKGPTAQQQGLAPMYSWLTSLAVTITKSLGLQYECNGWNISLAEKQIRTRLWWATFVMDSWISVDNPGGPLISSQDYTTPMPKVACDFNDGDYTLFMALASLTHLLARIYEAYYTVRATKEIGWDLDQSLELARPLRSALTDWKQSLKTKLPHDGIDQLGVHACVHLAGCVTAIILFRALLRPISIRRSSGAEVSSAQLSASTAVMIGSINTAREAVELLENLVSTVGPWSEFWHSWSQGNFAIVSTFLLELMLSSDGSTRPEILNLITRWRRAIRIGAGSGGWGSSLMSMALSRLESLLSIVV